MLSPAPAALAYLIGDQFCGGASQSRPARLRGARGYCDQMTLDRTHVVTISVMMTTRKMTMSTKPT
jgi:hypothetical protein